MRNVSLVPKDYSFVGDTYIWQDDAACAFWPSSMFELHDKESRIYEDFLAEAEGDQGAAHRQLQDFNKANFEKAATVCATCPVLDACLSSATIDDLATTFRAGLEPTHNRPAPWGRPKKEYSNAGDCVNGHKGSVVTYPSGKRSCRACSKERYEASRKNKPRQLSAPDAERCTKGHKDWDFRKRGNRLARYCKTCTRATQEAYRARMKA